MDIIMNDEHIVSIAQLQEFLKAVDGAVTFNSEAKGNKNKQKRYEDRSNSWQVSIWKIEEKEKGIVLEYLKQTTKLSKKNHLKKLIARKRKKKTLRIITGNRHVFRAIWNIRHRPSD